jgi:predicted nucleic acid-binding protein
MRRGVLADTGPLYAALDRDDTWHSRAQEEIKRLNAAGLDVIVLYSTLLEAYSLVLYKLGKRAAQHWLGDVVGYARLVNPAPEDYQAAGERLRAYPDQQLSLFDTVMAVMSSRLELPVWTHDHHFDVLRVAVWRGGPKPSE